MYTPPKMGFEEKPDSLMIDWNRKNYQIKLNFNLKGVKASKPVICQHRQGKRNGWKKFVGGEEMVVDRS